MFYVHRSFSLAGEAACVLTQDKHQHYNDDNQPHNNERYCHAWNLPSPCDLLERLARLGLCRRWRIRRGKDGAAHVLTEIVV